MNKKKKQQPLINMDTLTEVINTFTHQEQQEIMDLLNNELGMLLQESEELVYHYQCPDYSLEATPIADYLKRLWDMEIYEDYTVEEFKEDCSTVPVAELEKELRNFILNLFISYQGPLENMQDEEDRALKLWYIYWAMEHYQMNSSLEIILEVMRQSPTFLSSYSLIVLNSATKAIIYQLGQNQLPLLLSFMKEKGISFIGKEDTCNAIAQIAIDHPERRLEVINWFGQLLSYYYDTFGEEDNSDITMMDAIADILINIRAIETLPILEKIYKHYKIPALPIGKGFKEIKKEMSRAELTGLEIKSIEELINILEQSILNGNYLYEDEDEEKFENIFELEDEFDNSFYIETQIPKKLNLKISLIGSKPEVWRMLEVPSNIRLESFSNVINAAMGWKGYYMHLFQKGETIYSPDKDDEDFLTEATCSYSLSLGELLPRKGSHIQYEYNLEDSWLHSITLESQQAYKQNEKQGIFLLDGAVNCPPKGYRETDNFQITLESFEQRHSKATKEKRKQSEKEFNAGKFNAEKIKKELEYFPLEEDF